MTVSVPLLTAQMRGGMGRAASGGHVGFVRGVRRGVGPHHQMGPIYSGSPFLYSDYDLSEPYVPDNSVENPDESVSRQVAVMQHTVEDSPRSTRPAPLLIEWQGDRYVRFGGIEQTGERGASEHPDYAESTITGAPAKPEMSAVLVYRDGHREEISDYAIADGVIYVRGNYWQVGYWTKHIPLSALDPSATMQANQQRGVNFMLPSAPNMVIASF